MFPKERREMVRFVQRVEKSVSKLRSRYGQWKRKQDGKFSERCQR